MRPRPAGLLPALHDLPFVCPGCLGELEVLESAYRCPGACERVFPLQGGIPDFRISPDPYLSIEADHERTDRVLAVLDELPFPKLLERYWSWSEETPEPLRAKFVENALRGERRAGRLLALAEEAGLPSPASATILDVGSGTGNLLAAASGRFGRAVGIDIAMRWLHLSRRRFRDRGLAEPALVCGSAEAPPFPAAFFDAAFSMGTLEFTIPEMSLAQTWRILKPGGWFFVNTVNRFSIAPEPHVNLFGVGYLPRAWQAPYVRWRRSASFEHIRLRSRGELDRLLAPDFASREIRLPRLSGDDLAGFSPARRAAARIYQVASRIPVVRNALAWIVPEWDVILRKS